MNYLTPIRFLFYIGGLYDGLLGALFLANPYWLYRAFDVTLPNHPGYVQFPAALLVTFGIMFIQIASDPQKNRNLIPYGILLKVSFCGVAFYHWFAAGLPNMWKPFAVVDLIFLGLFFMAFKTIRHARA